MNTIQNYKTRLILAIVLFTDNFNLAMYRKLTKAIEQLDLFNKKKD